MRTLLTSIKISYRLALISVAYMMPVGALVYTIVGASTGNIEFAKVEIAGNSYLRPIEAILRGVSEYEISVNASLTGAQPSLDRISGDVDTALDELSKQERENGESVGFASEELKKRNLQGLTVSHLEELWHDFKGSAHKLSSEARSAKYQEIVATIRGMVARVGDGSKLILDPDLDSYYLVDLIVGALPQTQDRLASVADYTAAVLERGTFEDTDRVQFATFAAMVNESDLGRVVTSGQTAIAEDAQFFGQSESLQKGLPPLLNQYADETKVVADQLIDLSKTETFSQSKLNRLLEKLNKAREVSFALWDSASVELDKLLANRIQFFASDKWSTLLWNGLVLCATFVWVWYIGRSITKPLTGIMANLNSGAREIASVSKRVSKGSDELAASSTEQAAAIQETVASMAEMTSMVSQTVESARDSFETARVVNENAAEGNAILEKMVSSMDAIQQANSQLEEMAKIIAEISAKTTVINDIVFKTQLLSFNASIEAARAGQHGRGFAVVAEEVGNLAEMSGVAAKEIQALLDESKKQVGEIVQNNRERVLEGKAVSQSALTTFHEITRSIGSISGQIQKINDAMKEQESGISQTSSAMNEMNKSAQSTNAIATQNTEAARKILKEGGNLERIVGALKELVHGGQQVRPTKKMAEVKPRQSQNRRPIGKIIELDEPMVAMPSAPRTSRKVTHLVATNNESQLNVGIPDGIDADDDSFKPVGG